MHAQIFFEVSLDVRRGVWAFSLELAPPIVCQHLSLQLERLFGVGLQRRYVNVTRFRGVLNC